MYLQVMVAVLCGKIPIAVWIYRGSSQESVRELIFKA
jgi:hypothetical protein